MDIKIIRFTRQINLNNCLLFVSLKVKYTQLLKYPSQLNKLLWTDYQKIQHRDNLHFVCKKKNRHR